MEQSVRALTVSLLILGQTVLTHRAIAEAPLSAAETRSSFEHCNSRGCHKVSVVFSEGLEEAAPELVGRARRALTLAEERWGLPLRESLVLHFNARPDFHNGQATVVPRNTIFVLTEAPALDSSIGLTRDYLSETLVHEFGHMIPLQGNAGLFKLAGFFVGNASRPVGLWPRWIHEGLAVWTEARVGGRAESGFLDLELRRYADAARRHKRPPLENSDLDGAARFSRTEAGDLPYHFGYLLLDRWARDSGGGNAPVARLARSSAASLGSSFRYLFRDAGRDIDETFRAASADWAATRLPDAAAETGDKDAVEGAEEIRGPAFNEFGAAWLSLRDGKAWLVRRDASGKRKSARWRERYGFPEQVLPAEDGLWLALVRRRDDLVDGAFMRGGRNVRNFAELRSANGDLVCRIALPPRLREIDARAGRVSWVRSTAGGFFFAESAERKGCELVGPVREIARGRRRFERLSAPYDDGRVRLVSRSPDGDAYRERVEIEGQPIAYPRALSYAFPAPAAYCGGEEPCLLAHELSPRHWGPVALGLRSGQARFLKLATGASKSALLPDGSLLVREGRWEEDRLAGYSPASFSTDPQNPQAPAPRAAEPVPGESGVALEPYAAWPSIWPHFWWPSVMMGTRGALVIGQTFFSDTSERWSGAASAGYDTYFRRPFAELAVRRSELQWGPISRASVSAYSLPSYNYRDSASARPTQIRWNARAGVGSSAILPGELRADLDFSLGALQALPAVNDPGFTFFIPSLSLGLASPDGRPARYPDARAGLRFDSYARVIRSSETFASFGGHVPVFRRAALVGSLQYGWTHSLNYPESYFEWGSLPDLSTFTVPFLTRGFAPNLYSSSKIARFSAESVVNIASPSWALSWNRARLRHIDVRAVFETVTSRMPGSKFEIGRQYFTSAGLQIDAWGSILHYVGFNLGLGVFRGFGPYGQTRWMLQLGSNLEI